MKLGEKLLVVLGLVVVLLSCNNGSKGGTSPATTGTQEDLSEQIAKGSDDPELYMSRAKLNYQDGAYDQAIADLEKVISLDSLNPEAYHLLSDSYMDYYRSKDALMTMIRASERFPERIPTLLKLAETQLILKLNESSLFTVAQIFTLEPDNPEGHFMKGMNFRALGEIDKAINAFQKVTELDPEIIDAWLIAGDLLDSKGNELALDYYEAAINVDPKNTGAWHSKAFYLQNHGKDNEAIAIYKKINLIDKNYLDAYLNAGILYTTMDSLDQAMEQFNIMASMKPQNHLPYYYRGLIYEAQGNISAARTELQNCLNLKSDFVKAKQALNNLSAS